MIHPAYNKSEIARRYYEKATGEKLTNQEAINRLRKLRNVDKVLLRKVFDDVNSEAKKELKAS